MLTATVKPVVRDARTKVENWAGFDIRFVEVDGEWLGVAKDIAEALEYSDAQAMTRKVPKKYTCTYNLSVQGQKRKSLLLSEFGIYKAIFNSRKPEAEQFQDWVFNVIKRLREAIGIEGYQVFRLGDIEHQKKAMQRLEVGLSHPKPVDHIKANTIADKAVSNIHGLPKMIKKSEMTPEMLQERQPILDDTVTLMEVNDKFGLGISISRAVYSKTKTNQRLEV